MSEANLTDISGIGPATARVLTDHGFADIGSVASATTEELAKVPGFGHVKAKAAIEAARALTAGTSPTESKPAAAKGLKSDSKRKDKKGKKKKKGKDKKGKKKDKKGKKKKKDGKKKRKK